MKRLIGLALLAWALPASAVSPVVDEKDHHHHHGHHKHHKHLKHNSVGGNDKKHPTRAATATEVQPVAAKAAVQSGVSTVRKNTGPLSEASAETNSIVDKMKALEARLAAKAKKQTEAAAMGHLLVNGPLPADFNERFAQAVGLAFGTSAKSVHVSDSSSIEDDTSIVEIAFQASPKVVKAVEVDAADPRSKLAQGNLHSFLVAKSEPEEKPATAPKTVKRVKAASASDTEATPVQEKGIDIDTQMPYGDLEPFGREDTAQELTESSVKESDEMVDQLERAEVAEEKRSVFRALTRLRGAAITSFDGVARSQTGNIDEYNKVHKWRKTHPLHHLANEESDVTKWAFPDNADF